MVRLAIVGMGNIGCHYAGMILNGEISQVEIAAITRIRPERLKELCGLSDKNVPVFQSADELFEAVRNGQLELDAALIATPHVVHESQVLEALELGLHVLCDKPSGAFSSQARRMNEAAQSSDRLFAMMFNQRMNPMYQKMKEIVEHKIYGEMKRVNWVMTDWYRPNAYYDNSAWRGTWSTNGGGVLLDQCPHNLDLLQWICGMPVRVQAFCNEGRYHNIEVEDEVTAYLEFEQGATGVFYSTTGEASGINRLEISFDDALLVCENGALRAFELEANEPAYRRTAADMYGQLKGSWKEIHCPEENTMHKGVLQNFVDCILQKGSLLIEGTEGMNSLILSNAMYLSSWQKRMVEIPRTHEEQMRFEEEFEKEFAGKL